MSATPLYCGPDAVGALPVAAAVDALEAALAAGLDPEGQPPRSGLPLGHGELLVMPGLAAGHAVVKAVTVAPVEPRIQGVCILFEAETLAPVALLDGPALTVLRTAAVSALAVRHLAHPDARRLLVFGRGPQGRGHVEAVRAVRPIDEVHVLGRADADRAARVAAADVICCCTTAEEPLFDGDLVAEHACVVAIGSHVPEARETDDRLAARATVVVESRESALREAGDVIGALGAAAITPEDLVTLSEVVAGRVSPTPGPRLFKGVGMAWQDAVVAVAVLAAQSPIR